MYFWISAFDHRAIVLDKMHIVQWGPPFLLTLRFEAKAAARLGESQNSRGQVGEDACARTHVLTSALFARRISYAIHPSAVIGMRKIFLLDLRLGKTKSPGLSCNP